MPQIKFGLVAGVIIHAVCLVNNVFRPAGGDQIGLFDEIKDGVGIPFRIFEAAITGIGGGDGLDGFTAEFFQGSGP